MNARNYRSATGYRFTAMKWDYFPDPDAVPLDSAGRPKPTKYVGRTTRMGVEQYQDYTLYINDDRDGYEGRKLTDVQLCADWQREFPEAVAFTPHHVKGVRRDFMSGKRREGPAGSSHGVRGADGRVIGGASSIKY